MITNKGKRVYENVLDIPAGHSGPVDVKHVIKPAGTPVILSNMRTAMFGQTPLPPLTFDHDTRWHFLEERRYGVWMSDLPIEQRQHDEAFIGYKGRVLVGGLGLGYAVTVLAQKRHVERIVTVERSKHISKLVWEHTKHEGKGELVVADLFHYLRATTEKFDRAFFDIWQGDGESTFHQVVVPLRKLAVGKVKRVDCWNEDVMRGQLLMGITSRLMMLQRDPRVTPANFDLQIDSLCEKRSGLGAIYVNWALPFWRWYRREAPKMSEAQEMASTYARVYGLPRGDAFIEERFGERVEAAS
jgi:hypothetical protein